MSSSDRERTVYHEAGHAVVAAALGGRVVSASIVPEGNLNGMTWFYKPWHCCDQVAATLAGGVAVWEFGWRRGEKLSEYCAKDLEQIDADRLLWNHGKYEPREEDEIFIEGEARAHQAVGDYWGAIEAVAAWLLKHDVINGPLAHAIVARHAAKAQIKKGNNCDSVETK